MGLLILLHLLITHLHIKKTDIDDKYDVEINSFDHINVPVINPDFIGATRLEYCFSLHVEFYQHITLL